jgi:hypothetical protein
MDDHTKLDHGKSTKMFSRFLKFSMIGTFVGLLAAALAGGVWSALFGQPFSGERGMEVFHLGMVFPGLVIFGPVAAIIGAFIGAICSWSGPAKG